MSFLDKTPTLLKTAKLNLITLAILSSVCTAHADTPVSGLPGTPLEQGQPLVDSAADALVADVDDDDVQDGEKAIPDSWQNHLVGSNVATVLEFDGTGVQVGVIDVGYYRLSDHPQLLANPNLSVLSSLGDTAAENLAPLNHGAQVAGIIAAFPGENEGGIAQGARVHVVDFLSDDDDDDDDDGMFSKEIQDNLVAAFNELIEKVPGLNVINLSTNDDSTGDDPEHADRAYADAMTAAAGKTTLADTLRELAGRDVLTVFAAGNESKGQPGVMATLPRYMPELGKHLLSVVSVDSDAQLAQSSNRCGVSKDWCIAAPGDDVWVVDKNAEAGDDDENAYTLSQESGTSYAAPLVSGAAALIKQRFPYMSMAQVRDVMLTTAKPLLDGARVSDAHGWGLLDLAGAVEGPTQLLGDERYTLDADKHDSWHNRIVAGGHLTKVGAGSLSIMAENNQFAGVRVEGGGLLLNGSNQFAQHSEVRQGELRVDGRLVGPSLDVEQGGTLSGSGVIVADTLVKGTLVPDVDRDVDGRLAFRRQLTLDSASHTAIDGNRSIRMAGPQAVANLGGTLAVTSDNPSVGQSQTVLSTESGATYVGQFDALQQQDELLEQGLRQDLFYAANSIRVGVHDSDLPGQASLSKNARAGAEALNALRDTSLALSASGYNRWLQQALETGNLGGLEQRIGGQVHADAAGYLLQQPQTLQNRLQSQLGGADQLQGRKLWLERSGREVRHDGAGGINDSKDVTRTTHLGMTQPLDERTAVAGSLSQSHGKVTGNGGTVDADITQLSVGGRYGLDSLGSGPFVGGQANVGHVDLSSKRNLGSLGSAKGDSSGWLYSAGAYGGYRWQQDDLFVEPRVGLRTSRMTLKGFTEKGSEADLRVDSRNLGSTSAQADLSVGYRSQAGDWVLTPSANLGYQRLLSGDQPTITSTLGDMGIRQQSAGQGADRFSAGLNLAAKRGQWSIDSALEKTTGSGSHGAKASFNLGFEF